MARYRATAYIPGLAVAGAEFESDAVPGLTWEPLDAAAEKAVADAEKARAERLAAATAPKVDPKVAELETALEEAWSEIERLKAELAKFDRDGDGKAGGSTKKPAA